MLANAGQDENIILEAILKYKEFNRFYTENRSKILYEISWCKDIDLEDNHIAYSDLGVHEIHIKNFPKSKTDAFVIAHELLHFIRYERMLPLMHSDNRYLGLAEALLSLLEDPIVDSILKTQYNFNLRPLYMKGIENGKREAGSDYADDINRVRDGFIHASWTLKWRLIEDRSALKSWRKYFRRLEDGRPNAYKIGLDTVAIIDEVGLDTIEQQKIIVNKLIEKYNPHFALTV
jgi:hypothetical protein